VPRPLGRRVWPRVVSLRSHRYRGQGPSYHAGRDSFTIAPMPHAANLRTGRFSENGRIYLITTATVERSPVFTDFVLARQAIHALRKCDETDETRTLCFVLMPDHLHWLFELCSDDLSGAVRRFKSTGSRWINRTRDTPGAPLWQAGFHDHALRREEDMQGIARYIVANPLRAGLVSRIGEYPHWDAAWL